MDDNEHEADISDDYNKRNTYRGINPLVVKIAKITAQKVIGKHGFTDSDLPDLEQEFVNAGLTVLEQCEQVIGDGGGLIMAAIRSRLNAILHQRYARKRDWRKLASLHEELPGSEEDEEGSTLIDYVASCGHLGPFDAEERNPAYKQMRCQDVNAAISRLPPEYQAFCEDLKSMSRDEIMAKYNLTIDAFYHCLAKIRRFFLYFLGEDEFGDPPRPDHRPIVSWERE